MKTSSHYILFGPETGDEFLSFLLIFPQFCAAFQSALSVIYLSLNLIPFIMQCDDRGV